jgi:penicillin V acylase-like amidase (Ntn superfamily)
MCSRVLYVGEDGLVVTGRSMDWMIPTGSNIWALPAGLTRDGAAATNSLSWTSVHGSVITTMYDGVTIDGVNDAGLGANALYLSSATYPKRDPALPGLSVAAWTQYALDMFGPPTRTCPRRTASTPPHSGRGGRDPSSGTWPRRSRD